MVFTSGRMIKLAIDLLNEMRSFGKDEYKLYLDSQNVNTLEVMLEMPSNRSLHNMAFRFKASVSDSGEVTVHSCNYSDKVYTVASNFSIGEVLRAMVYDARQNFDDLVEGWLGE